MGMTSSPEAMGRGSWVIFEKKQELRFKAGRSGLILELGESSCVLRDARAFVGLDGTVSIVEIVSLSPHVEKPKSQEGNKSFVPEQRESSVFRVFRDSYAYEHFTYPYISRIRIICIMDMLNMYNPKSVQENETHEILWDYK